MEKELSASKAGFPCMRNLWYTVNGYGVDSETDKRTQQIFDVGTALEPVAVDWLRQDGWTVEYNPGSQKAELKVSIPVRGGMLTGHPDCIISKGEIQNALVDVKTMNDRAFTLWKREGTQKSKPQYATQEAVKFSVYRHNFSQHLQAVCSIKTQFYVQSQLLNSNLRKGIATR